MCLIIFFLILFTCGSRLRHQRWSVRNSLASPASANKVVECFQICEKHKCFREDLLSTAVSEALGKCVHSVRTPHFQQRFMTLELFTVPSVNPSSSKGTDKNRSFGSNRKNLLLLAAMSLFDLFHVFIKVLYCCFCMSCECPMIKAILGSARLLGTRH